MVLLLMAAHAFATAATQPPSVGGLSVERAVVAAGSGRSSGGAFVISGTVGQPDAEPLQPSTGGDFAITGGFWITETAVPETLFQDGFEGLQ